MQALITGGLGQDGSFLSEHLLRLGYEVYATCRMMPELHENYIKQVKYVYADLRDEHSLEAVIRKSQPDEIYNLGGQTFVPTSFHYPSETLDVNTGGLVRILQVVEKLKIKTKIYQASTSEMYGNSIGRPGILVLDENSPMHPVSPYAVSKHAAHELVHVYRQRGMFVVSGILFNHESERRGPEMVTRKITRHIAQWKYDQHLSSPPPTLHLGAIDSKRDWGYAGDYVKAMHLMLHKDIPEGFVIGTGHAYSVEHFLQAALKAAYLDEEYLNYVKSSCDNLNRQPELRVLVADNTKAQRELGWAPENDFYALVKRMVDHDYSELEKACTVK